MSDTTDVTSGVPSVAGAATAGPVRRRRTGTGLSAMLLPELQSLAASLGISGTARMRKGDLIAAISERQSGSTAATTPRPRAEVAAAAAPVREEVRAEVTVPPAGREGPSAEAGESDRRAGGRRAEQAVAEPTAEPDSRAERPERTRERG
ncbi:MAG TPA: Rho termination factor N-terminal domain-containing protein, partial [Micromonosporaceae bacterium]